MNNKMAVKCFDLPCLDSRKSFYGKAQVIEYGTGEKWLKSYNTYVCMITPGGEFVRKWYGESATTMRHINSFLKFYGIDGGGIAWWRQQPIQDGIRGDLVM